MAWDKYWKGLKSHCQSGQLQEVKKLTADEQAFAALNNLWELYYLGKICIFICLQAPHLNFPLLFSAFQRHVEGLFLAHLVLKFWKKRVSVLDNTSTFWFFCHRLKTTLQIKIILWKKRSNLTFQNARKGPLAVSQRLRDIPPPLALEEAWSSRETFFRCAFFPQQICELEYLIQNHLCF